MEWTSEQREVIDTRDKNILVSAAAGSGKTAVLTQRILQLVMDEEHPMDIDKLVVVTFTKAAAGEMRERILKTLQGQADFYLEKINRDEDIPESRRKYEYLERQLSYIHNARIMTIDSFCMEIVRENFAFLDIDPTFKVGEEGELTLLKADVMEELLERYYEEAAPDFLNFVDIYSSSRSDHEIEEMIYTMHRFAMSYPYPEEWIQSCADAYACEGDSFEESGWYQALKEQAFEQLELIHEDIESCLHVCGEEEGPYAYEPAILSDLSFVEAVQAEESYEGRQRLFAGLGFEALSRKKDGADAEKKNYVKSVRDDYKKLLKKMAEQFYQHPREQVIEDLRMVRENAAVLSKLVIDFKNSYDAAKREKNLVDFNDLEHFALEILVFRDEEGNHVPSPAAMEMARDIGEIMIDEYQDSNYVQELILIALSGKTSGRNNLFMVGDVKQSIYKFRMAKPELFMEKYATFQRAGEGPDRKIILSKNFRSRKTVLDVANLVFEKIMIKSLGGIDYDKESALYYGADYEGGDTPVEIWVADTSLNENETELEDDINAAELEAEMVALRILELYKSGFLVKGKEGMRAMRYSDVAVLFRSMGERAELYEQAFLSKGIPVRYPVKKGCFDSFEVTNILEFLAVIDNPRQDIPLTAVLKNIFHLNERELAQIKIWGQKKNMYENVRVLAGVDDYETNEYAGEDRRELERKVKRFYTLLQKYRQEKTYLTIYDLINHILEDTGFEYFVSAFPDGSIRMMNIAMLKERASVYQQGSYSGLFHFIRYIEKNKMYEVEQEQMNRICEEDAVTMMTIHKSKGLEFPIVVVAALGKQFNQDDARKKIVLHHTFGMGMDRFNSKRSIYSRTLLKRIMAAQIVAENLAEEIRVLYVAMTRAKEKLILAGAGKMERKWEKYERLFAYAREHGHFHRNQLSGAGSFLDLILMSLMDGKRYQGNPKNGYEIHVCSGQELAGTMVRRAYEEELQKQVLQHWNQDISYNQKTRERIEENLAFVYSGMQDVTLQAKVSVSDIKQQFMKLYDEEEELTEELRVVQEEQLVPSFLADKKEETRGNVRGNAYHRVFELLDYHREFSDMQSVEAFLEELLENGLITKEIKKCVKVKDILIFLSSPVGQRMKAACRLGKLKREQQFVIGIPAGEIKDGYEGNETVLVQGIMDAYFEEGDTVCVVDYKTDYVREAQELISRYQVQLDYYAYALKKITGKSKVEKIIYSVKLGKEIRIS